MTSSNPTAVSNDLIADLGVILVSYDGLENLQRLLPGLMRNVKRVKGRVCLVDNASDDTTLEWVACNYPEILIIANDRNLGFARANNQGLAALQARYYLLLNTDTEFIDDDTLHACVVHLDQHLSVGMMGCVLLNGDLSLQPSTYRFPSVFRLILRAIGLKALLLKTASLLGSEETLRNLSFRPEKHHYRLVDVIKGAFCMVRATAVDDVGFLDTTTFMYGEEADWAYRFRLHGWETHYFLGARVIHYGRSRRLVSSLEIEKLRGLLNFVGKHRSLDEMRLVALFFAVSHSVYYFFEWIEGKMSGLMRRDSQFSHRPIAIFCWSVFRSGDIHVMPHSNLIEEADK